MRAIAAWRASGMRWRASMEGDLDDLLATFAQLGVPADLIWAARQGANLTHKPIVVMAPLVWLAACKIKPRHRRLSVRNPPPCERGDAA